MARPQHRILIADKLPDSGVEALRALGAPVDYHPDCNADQLPELISEASVLIVRSTKVKALSIEKGTHLQLIVRAGAGVDNIDQAKAAALGIYVANCPGKNATAVAELAIGLLLAADRRIAAATADLVAGQWRKKEYGKAQGLYGRALGILGVGQIGALVIQRAQALGMRILAYSRSLTLQKAQELGVQFCADPLEVARNAYAVSIHLPSTSETKHFVGEEFLNAMQPGAILINTARGEIVDLEALERSVHERKIRPALDVFEGEPGSGDAAFEAPIRSVPGFVGTPHIGASTDQAQDATIEEAIRITQAFMTTGNVPNCVNLAERTPARFMLVVRHFDRVGVLAAIFDELRRRNINVERTNNIVFQGAQAAVARIELDGAPGKELLDTIRKQEHVLSADLIPL